MHTQQLLAFLTAIGIDRAGLAPSDHEVEALDRYTLVLPRPAAALNTLTPDLCQNLVSAFGPAVTLRVGDREVPALEIRHGELPPDLTQRLARAQASPGSAELRLDIDKQVIASRLIAPESGAHGKYFLFAAYLRRFLDLPLPDLDAQLFAGDVPTVLVVGDADVHYTGQILTVVGEGQIATARLRTTPLSRQIQARLERYRGAAAEQLSWVGFRLDRLTPLHFLSERRGAEDPALTTSLTRHLLHLSILYSANRASRADQGYEAVYASSDRTVALNLRRDDAPPPDRRSLIRFALWPYDGNGGTDRLTVLQNVIARELDDSQEPLGIAAFAARLTNLLDEARWNYRTFIDKQIDQHFVQLRGAKDYVAETTKKVGDAVDTVTKGLTEVLLATLGVIVAALLAALTKPQEEGRIVDTIMRLYALYLGAQAVLRLGSTLHGILLLRSETAARLEDLRLVLGRRNVEAISRPLFWRWWQFGVWFGITLIFFVALGFGVLNWVPDFVRAAAPTPSATPTGVMPPTPTP